MITANALREMSERRGEPGWMREARLESARRFHDLAAPTWGGGLSEIEFGDVLLDKIGLGGIDAVIGPHSDAAGQATREEADAVATAIRNDSSPKVSCSAPWQGRLLSIRSLSRTIWARWCQPGTTSLRL